jgi:hypothetical protein
MHYSACNPIDEKRHRLSIDFEKPGLECSMGVGLKHSCRAHAYLLKPIRMWGIGKLPGMRRPYAAFPIHHLKLSGNLYPRWEWLELDQELRARKETGSPQRIHHTIPKEDRTADLQSSTNHPVKIS